MTPPTRVKIGAHSWKVSELVEIEADQWLFGRTRPRWSLIEITKGQSASQKRDTVLHEVLHAIIEQGSTFIEDHVEEALVRDISPLLLGVLRENPNLLKFLLDKEV